MDRKEYVNIEYIHPDGTFEGTLNFKPVGQGLFLVILGAALLFLKVTVAIVLGVLFILIGLAGLVVVKDRRIIDFYSDCLVFYDPEDPGKGRMISYDDVKSWSIDSANRKVMLTLSDEETLSGDCNRTMKAFTLLNKTMKDKSTESQIKSLYRNFRNK